MCWMLVHEIRGIAGRGKTDLFRGLDIGLDSSGDTGKLACKLADNFSLISFNLTKLACNRP